LRLILEQAADRVRHRVQVLHASSLLLAELQSVEGTSADEWPPSPPLQSCSVEEIHPGKTAAFLVGMSGKSHWSGSIEPRHGEGEIFFDFACRVNAPPAWLGTTYAACWPSDRAAVNFQLSPQGILVRPAETAIGTALSGTFPITEPLRIGCLETVPSRFPATLRWQYRICIS
jgi:hypothetical protein